MGLNQEQTHDLYTLWLPVLMCAAVVVVALWIDVRRDPAAKRVYITWLGGTAGGILGVRLMWLIDALPSAAQATVVSRLHLAAFLFWLAAFVFFWSAGWVSLVESSAIVGFADARRRGARKLVLFEEGFYTLVQRSSELSRSKRVTVFLHHAIFSVAVLCASGTALLMTLGFPKSPRWVYLLASILAAVLLNPARSDRRRLSRLSAGSQPDARLAESP